MSAIIYLLTMVCTTLIAGLFYKSKDGALRKHLIGFFSTFSFAMITRAIEELHPGTLDSLIIIGPLFISTLGLTIHLMKNYNK